MSTGALTHRTQAPPVRRVGRRMAELVMWLAGRNDADTPTTMRDAALFVGPNGSSQYGYRTVHRAIDAGLVDVVTSARVHRSAAGELFLTTNGWRVHNRHHDRRAA